MQNVSFIKKSTPPPKVKEGEVLVARVVEIEYPVESKYADEQGRKKQQIRFRLALPNSFEFNSWMTYYESPSDKSALGVLSITYMNLTHEPVESVKEVLEGLDKRGNVYVKCSGFRDYNGKAYPKFKVLFDKLPPLQQSLGSTKPKENSSEPSRVELDRLSPELREKVLTELCQ